MSPILENPTHDEFEKQVKKYLRYEKMVALNNVFIFMWLAIPLVLAYFTAYLIRIELTTIWQLPLIGCGFIISYASVKLLQRKLRKYHVEDDEWARFYTSSIYTNLKNYLETKSSGMKKEYRKKALKNTKDFLSCIEEKWKVGNFKPVKLYVGSSLADLKKNLCYRVIPAIKDGDDELFKKVSQIMSTFLFFSKTLSIENINKLNNQMSKKEETMLPDREPLKIGYFARGSKFFKTHRILKHSFAVAGFAVICVALGYVGVTCFSITNNYAWGGSIALFSILLATYFSRQPKIEK